MASSTALVVQRSRPRASGLVLAAASDRARAFQRARVHSIVVRLLRLALPLAGLGLAATYVISFKLASGVGGFTLPTPPTITADDLVMNAPRYEGFGKGGERFIVTARTARQELRDRSAPVQLTGVDGKLTLPDQTVTDLTATRGTFDTKQSQLELFDGVKVVSQSGMTATLSQATVLTKEHKIVSREPVHVEMPTGAIRARQMAIDQKTRQVAFTDGVTANLRPERKSNTAEAQPAAPARAFGSGDQPVDVTAERLDVDDTAKTAVFLGKVRAMQGGAVLESAQLDIAYDGQAGLPASGADPQSPGSRVKRIVAPTPIVLTQGTDKVTADRAEFEGDGSAARLIGSVVMMSGADRHARADRADLDQRNDTVLLTGNVLVTQARNELKGRRLAVDRKSGRALLTSPATPGLAAGRISTRLYQGDGKEPAAAKKTVKAPPQPAQGAAGLGMAGVKTDPSQPIDVEAVSLDVNDVAHTAVYRGDVRAAQGDFKMATAEMTAFYTGQMGLNVAPGPTAHQPAVQAAPRGQQVQLTRIEARKGVTVTTADGQTVSGDWADFDVKANTVTIGGNVKLASGQSVGHGGKGKLVIDLNTGENRLQIDDAVAAAADRLKRQSEASAGWQPRDSGAPTQPLVAPIERPRMVIHPDHLKGIGPGGKSQAAPPPAQAQAAKPQAGTAAPTPTPSEQPQRRRPSARATSDEPTSIFGAPGGN